MLLLLALGGVEEEGDVDASRSVSTGPRKSVRAAGGVGRFKRSKSKALVVAVVKSARFRRKDDDDDDAEVEVGAVRKVGRDAVWKEERGGGAGGEKGNGTRLR